MKLGIVAPVAEAILVTLTTGASLPAGGSAAALFLITIGCEFVFAAVVLLATGGAAFDESIASLSSS
jgi:hypothetical protein